MIVGFVTYTDVAASMVRGFVLGGGGALNGGVEGRVAPEAPL